MINKDNPCHKYAQDVVDEKILTCKWVKLAAKRHLKDLENEKWKWYFDEEESQRAYRFFNTCLVLDGAKGQEKFKLFDWQYFVLGSCFGWRSKRTPAVRRFKEVYCETARGAGKSPFAAGIAIYTTFGMGIQGVQSFCLAKTAEQANAVFRNCGRYAEYFNETRPAQTKFNIFKQASAPYIISFPQRAQLLKKLTSEVGGSGKSGYVAHCVIADEIMELANSSLLDKLKSSMKKNNPTPLLFQITNAGFSQDGICWEIHERSKRLLDPADKYKHDRELALIYTLDDNDDPYKDEECWHKANPSLKYGVPSIEFYRDMVKQVRGNPSQEAEVNRALFSIWTAGASPWISAPEFEKITTKNPDNIFPSEDELKKMRCYAGVDLSSNIDLTSITLAWKDPKKDMLYLRNHSFIPADNDVERKERKDKSPYRNWEKGGFVTIVDSGVIRYEDIADYIKDLQKEYKLEMMTLDSYRLHDFLTKAKNHGLPLYKKNEGGSGIAVVFCRQGRGQPYKKSDDLFMPRLIEIFENRIKQNTIMIDYNPCLTKAAVSSMLVPDAQGNRIFNKEKSYSRIDPIVATVEAIGLADKFGGASTGNEITAMWLNDFK